MGWSGGNEILEALIDELNNHPLVGSTKRDILAAVIKVLGEGDWDTEDDTLNSEYGESLVLRAAFQQAYPSNYQHLNTGYKEEWDKELGGGEVVLDEGIPPHVDLRPWTVTLCGSTRFWGAFQDAALTEILRDHAVFSVGCDTKADGDWLTAKKHVGDTRTLEEVKHDLDQLHKRKIDLSDEVFILNVDDYIGQSTKSELDYARQHDKKVRWLYPSKHAQDGEEIEIP
jgi:hypothetical protein